jgi:hypothetical protein
MYVATAPSDLQGQKSCTASALSESHNYGLSVRWSATVQCADGMSRKVKFFGLKGIKQEGSIASQIQFAAERHLTFDIDAALPSNPPQIQKITIH